MVLNDRQIKECIQQRGFVEGYIDLATQLTPNGFDLTVGDIFSFDKKGALDFSNKERRVPDCKRILPKKQNPGDKFGWWNLKKGTYKIRTNEVIKLPNDLVALAFSRTSLLRMGAFTQHGIWDAGFRGRSEFILVVENNRGIRIKQNARIAQIVFMKTKKTDQGYRGIYQQRH